MHPNPLFRKQSQNDNLNFVIERSFGILTINAENGPLISHIPFRLTDTKNFVEAHLIRSNPILHALEEPKPAVLVVSGSDAYISPDWYEMGDQQVPTWNYVAIHMRGMLRRLPDEELYGILDRLSREMESRIPRKHPWAIDKLTDETFSKMSKQIAPIGFNIEEIQGTWKLSQNKSLDARNNAANEVERGTTGAETSTLSQLMHGQ